MKKSFLVLIVLSLLFVLFNFNVKADEKLSDFAKAAGERVTTNISGPMELNVQRIQTINNCTHDKTSPKYFYQNHTVNWIDFSTDAEYKIVTYSGLNADKWKAMTTRQACIDFEKNHPGWLVVAGVNGDFFENSGNTTFQPTNNFMTMGDMFRAEKASASYRQNIGWKIDGSLIVGDPTISTNMYLRIYDEETSSYDAGVVINTVNKTPGDGITLLTKDASGSFDLSGYNVYICNYDICRISTGGYVFVKGEVSEKVNNLASVTIPNGKFYLCTKGDLSLNTAAKIKCEYKYEGEWADVENSMGYVYKILENGERLLDESTSDFCYINHPRTLMGFRSNGSMIIMVVDGRGTAADYKEGVSLAEAAELLRIEGCVEGYNFDGGGSSTLVVRNNYGGFEVVNTPSDGSERSDGNHTLVIMRDPGFRLDSSTSTASEIVADFKITDEDLFKNTTIKKISCNNQTVDYDGSKISFKGLQQETTYEVEITYEGLSNYDNSIVQKKLVKYVTTPRYKYPDPGLSVSKITDTSVTITKNMKLATAEYITNVVVHLGIDTYNMGSAETFTINDLISDTTYSCYFSYEIHDPSGVTYYDQTEPIDIKTLSFKVPEIVNFAENKFVDGVVSIDYKYTDTDRVVTKAYIMCNDKEYVLNTKLGTYRFTDLDFEHNDYDFKLVIEYEDEAGTKYILESDVLSYKKTASDETPVTPVDPTPSGETGKKKKCGKKSLLLITSLLSITSLLFFIRKKH